VDEDGLPIVDISEPLPNDASGTPVVTPLIEDDLTPLKTLSPSDRTKLQAERERILDLLEEEERIEQKRDEELELEQRRQAAQKRAEAAKAQMESLKAAKEMQKRMGKALIRNISEAREKEEKAKKAFLDRENKLQEERKVVKQKKSVSFAELPQGGDGEPKDRMRTRGKDVGDVTFGRLRPRDTKMSDSLVMKMAVVEKIPETDQGDSDDEPLLGSPISTDRWEESAIRDNANMETDINDEPGLEEDYDLDAARHHREIALQYYKKRCAITQEASEVMTATMHDEDPWDQPVSVKAGPK
jgi:hypothetical protein